MYSYELHHPNSKSTMSFGIRVRKKSTGELWEGSCGQWAPSLQMLLVSTCCNGPVGFVNITHAMEMSFVGSRDISNVYIVPCNSGCDVSAAPRTCFCLLTDLQPWIWVPLDLCLIKNRTLSNECYWKKNCSKINSTFPESPLLDYVPGTPWSPARPSASCRIHPAQWDGILSTHLFFVFFQSWYGERAGGQWVLNVLCQILAVQNWPSGSSSGGYAMPYSLCGHPVHSPELCPNKHIVG